MTITVPANVQHPPAVNGFDQLNYPSVGIQQQSLSATTTVDAEELSVTATVSYSDGTSEADIAVVPELRPSHNAALHVVGQAFLEAIPGLTENRIRRFR